MLAGEDRPAYRSRAHRPDLTSEGAAMDVEGLRPTVEHQLLAQVTAGRWEKAAGLRALDHFLGLGAGSRHEAVLVQDSSRYSGCASRCALTMSASSAVRTPRSASRVISRLSSAIS